MVDFDAVLYGPLHSVFGTEAVITPTGGTVGPATVTVIDNTRGMALQLKGSDIETVVPVAVVRASALADASLTRSDLRRAALTMNGRTYRIESTMPRPTPGGEADGEVLMILTEDA